MSFVKTTFPGSDIELSKNLKTGESNFNGEHVREGLVCIVAVKLGNPEFERRKKTRFANPEASIKTATPDAW